MQQIIKQNPVLVMLIANMMLAGNSVLAKISYESMPVTVFIGLRYFFVGVVFLLLAQNAKRYYRQGATLHLLLNIILQTIVTFTWLIAIQFTQAINASILFLLIPVVVYVASIVLLKEPRSMRALAGSLVALVGGVMLFGAPVVSTSSSDELMGNGLLLIAVFAFALLIVHTKKLYGMVDQNTIIGTRFFAVGLIGLMIAVVNNDFAVTDQISRASWLALLLSITVAGVLGILLFYRSLQEMRAEDSAALFYVDPLTGAVLGALVLGETMSSLALVASGVIIVGVLISHPVQVHRMHYYQTISHSKFEEFLVWLDEKYKNVIKTAKKAL